MPLSSNAAAHHPLPAPAGLRPTDPHAWPDRLGGLDEAALWPADVLEAFSLRMMRNGHCVSSGMMQRDRRYALSQLAHAHSLQDDILHELAQDLFRHFEHRQSGLPRIN